MKGGKKGMTEKGQKKIGYVKKEKRVRRKKGFKAEAGHVANTYSINSRRS